MIEIDEAWVEALAYGGAILGGGGGGSLKEGLRLGKLALELGHPVILDVEELPEDSLIITVSGVGAPSTSGYVKPFHYLRSVELLRDHLGQKIRGLITNEMGGLASLNGFIQSAVLGIPVLDAACNGRAHPTGPMGSMGLSRQEDFTSHQSAVGGNPPLELYVKGELSRVSRVIRRAAELAGGILAVARNPVPLRYVKEHAAVGALSHAVQLGQAFLQARNSDEKAQRIVEMLNGKVVDQGQVKRVSLTSRAGFDVGKAEINDLELSFWNEYMTLERGGERLATFPDLIMTLEVRSGRPLTTAELQKGQEVIVITAPKEQLKLGAGMRDPTLFKDIEQAIGKDIISYTFPKEALTCS